MSADVELQAASAVAGIRESTWMAPELRSYYWEDAYNNVYNITNETVVGRVMVAVRGAEYRDYRAKLYQQWRDQILK